MLTRLLFNAISICMRMKQVDAEQWASFLAQYRSYGTEPDANTMRHVHSDTHETLAEVRYSPSPSNDKTYWVTENPTSPKS